MGFRKPRTTQTFGEIDYTVPIVKENFKMEETDCFGKGWDMTTAQCPQCADRDVCSILSRAYIDKKAKKVEEKLAINFLDSADFTGMESKIMGFVKDGKTTVQELLQFTMTEAKMSDEKTAVIWLKNFIKQEQKIHTKGGLVWVK